MSMAKLDVAEAGINDGSCFESREIGLQSLCVAMKGSKAVFDNGALEKHMWSQN